MSITYHFNRTVAEGTSPDQDAAQSAALADESRKQACLCADRAEKARDVALTQTVSVNTLLQNGLTEINNSIAAAGEDQQAAVNRACLCADRSEQARDAAMEQAAGVSALMETELAKINNIIAINQDDQKAAVAKAKAWAENPEDVPVDTTEDGRKEYSAMHWALKNARLMITDASKTRKGVVQIGDGIDVEAGLISVPDATTEKTGLMRPDGLTCVVNGAGVLSVLPATCYELCEFYYFRHPTLRPGFQPAQGGLLANAATLYPEAWAYLQTTEGKKLCKTEAEWQAMTKATWATLADGSRIGWNGIGGAPFYAPNLKTGALRLPDLRGMYAEAAGFDALGVGGVHGDGMRNIVGTAPSLRAAGLNGGASDPASGVLRYAVVGSSVSLAPGTSRNMGVRIDTSLTMPTAAKNQPRAWGALACVYLGAPK